MCGRYTMYASYKDIARRFNIELPDDDAQIDAHYNAAPTQLLPVLTARSGRVEFYRWGLIPFWAKDASIGNKLINARAETLADKPSFRHAFRSRRCLVVADGFYEWKKTEGGKTPVYIRMASGEPFAIAGIWDEWHDPDSSETIRSFAIITTEPNELMEEIHNRMPAVLRREDEELWLDPGADPQELLHALRPFPAEEMEAYEVSRAVNNPRNDDSTLIEPVESAGR